MAIPLNPGNFSALAAAAGNMIPNLNLGENMAAVMNANTNRMKAEGSLFEGLGEGMKNFANMAYKQNVLDKATKDQPSAPNPADQEKATLNQSRYDDKMALENKRLAIQERYANLAEQKAQREQAVQQQQQDIQARSQLDENDLYKRGSLAGSYIIQYRDSTSKDEQYQLMNKIINVGKDEGILSDEEFDIAKKMTPPQFYQQAMFDYLKTKGALDLRTQGFNQSPQGEEVVEQSPDADLAPITESAPVTGTPVSTKQSKTTRARVPADPTALTPSVKTSQQKAITDADVLLNNLHSLQEKYSDTYLTYKGRTNKRISETAEKVKGVPAVDYITNKVAEYTTGMDQNQRSKFIKDSTAFMNQAEQIFQQYRKAITGAQASDREIKMLREIFLNPEMSPSEFQSSMNGLIERAGGERKQRSESLRSGITSEPSRTYRYGDRVLSDSDIDAIAKRDGRSREEVIKAISKRQ